jgi:hypothetical protein
MFRFLVCFVVFALALMPVGCSDTSTDPENEEEEEEEEETVYRGLLFDYQLETGNAVHTDITPGAGGSLTATGSNGVSYKLVISPEAVDTIHNITITPFSGLTITTLDSTVQDTSACLQGALFEPEGLEFDSLAVLTITFPGSGVDCSLSDDYRVILFDDESAFYEIMSTDVNQGTSALACTLTHFSNYGTDDMSDYDFLKYMIEGTAKYGKGFPGYSLLEKLISYSQEATLQGWDDLRVLAIQGCHPILDKLADNAIPGALADPGVSSFRLLHYYLEAAFRLAFDDIAHKLKNALDGVVRGHASAGQAQCAAGNHSAGKAMLWRALEWSQRGFIQSNPDAFEQLVEDMLDDCGDLNISLGSTASSLYNLAMDEGSLDACVFTLTLHISSPTGNDLEGKSVTIRQEGEPSNSHNGTTDAGGTFSVGMTGAMILGLTGCLPSKEATFIGETFHNGEWLRSNVRVTANKVPLFSSITYEHSYSASEGSANASTTASIIGQGTAACNAGPYSDCSSFFSRSYSTYSTSSSTVDVIPDTLLIPACRATPIYEVGIEDVSGLSVPYLTGIRVAAISDIFKNLYANVCGLDGSCSKIGFSIPTCAIETAGYCPPYTVYIAAIPGDELIFTSTGGSFDPYLWTGSDSNGYGTASMSITVGLGI